MSNFIKLKKNLVLASGSTIRKTLLSNAGLQFEIFPADINEEQIRLDLEKETPEISPLEIAGHLAREKAVHVSRIYPDACIIGSDQVLALGNRIFGKPENLDQAYERLALLNGRTHQLHTAVCLAYESGIIWNHTETVHMTMKNLSPSFLKNYLAEAGEEVCNSVGAYQLEGLGVHLFSDIEGNYFTILGLSLIPLLNFMREQGIIEP